MPMGQSDKDRQYNGKKNKYKKNNRKLKIEQREPH